MVLKTVNARRPLIVLYYMTNGKEFCVRCLQQRDIDPLVEPHHTAIKRAIRVGDPYCCDACDGCGARIMIETQGGALQAVRQDLMVQDS